MFPRKLKPSSKLPRARLVKKSFNFRCEPNNRFESWTVKSDFIKHCQVRSKSLLQPFTYTSTLIFSRTRYPHPSKRSRARCKKTDQYFIMCNITRQRSISQPFASLHLAGPGTVAIIQYLALVVRVYQKVAVYFAPPVKSWKQYYCEISNSCNNWHYSISWAAKTHGTG